MDIQARPLTLHPVPSGTHLGGAWKFKDTSWVIPEGSEPLWSAGGRGGGTAHHPDGNLHGPKISKVGSVDPSDAQENAGRRYFILLKFLLCGVFYNTHNVLGQ